MKTQIDKAEAFQALHHQPEPFIMPNPWDAGSAKMLASSRFSALATTSAGFAFTQGRSEGVQGRNDVMAHAREIVDATELPVSADLENMYADDLSGIVETLRAAADAGLVGGSIEDADLTSEDPIYGIEEAIDRVRAAAEAARSLPFKFMLTARAENFLYGRSDLNDTIRRLQAYQEAGADVLYAPGLSTSEDIAAVTSSVDLPVNVLAKAHLTFDDFAELGVKRISVGSSLFCRAFGVAVDAAREMANGGTFGFTGDAMTYGEINAMFGVED